MKERIKTGLLLVLASIGGMAILIVLAWFLFTHVWESGPSYKVLQTIASPAGDYTATYFTNMGGNAAGWCYQEIAVNTESDPFSIKTAKAHRRNVVFYSDCDANIHFSWRSNCLLFVRFSFGQSNADGLDVYMLKHARVGNVKIEYEVDNRSEHGE